jgi:predicted regulator of Ras-like GTPase activity (Roadblock/LC7/MglB family)
MKFFNLMKGFFGRPAEVALPDSPSPEEITPAETEPETVEPAALEEPPTPVAVRHIQPAPAPAASETSVSASRSEIKIPLAVLIASFPVELQQRVKTDQIGTTVVAFPLDRILSQLGQGQVRATFGEIRASAPHAFLTAADRDDVLVTLPLGELVSRVNPAMLFRRPGRQVEVPEDIASPFGANGQGLMVSQGLSRPPISPLPRGAQSVAPIPPSTDLRARGNVTSVQRPPAPTAFPAGPGLGMRPPVSATPASGFTPPPAKPPIARSPIAGIPSPAAAPLRPAMPAPRPMSHGGNGGNGGSHGPASQPMPHKAADASPLWVAVALLVERWPEALQLEVAQLNLGDAKLALPADQVETGLKRGRVAFTWKTIRSWIRPAPLPSVSAHDGLMVDLPLEVLAPLFLLRQRQLGGGPRRVVVDEKIPNLFFGFPQGEPATVPPPPAAIPVVPAPKPADTNYFVWDDDKEVARIEGGDQDQPATARPAPSPGTNFMSRKATPNEVVMKASLLEGVYGALVALPDGLLVASKLDPALNGDTLAGFLPQLYSKMSGCTKELRMGELNNLNFTVGNVPWKIFRVNGIFFAAFGRAGEPMPTAHLVELAAELDYKKAQ